jgi:hypothetical protein
MKRVHVKFRYRPKRSDRRAAVPYVLVDSTVDAAEFVTKPPVLGSREAELALTR